jgi:hypothetical protein
VVGSGVEPPKPTRRKWKQVVSAARVSTSRVLTALPAGSMVKAAKVAMPLHPGFPQATGVPSPSQYADVQAKHAARRHLAQQQARTILQHAVAQHSALGSAPSVVQPSGSVLVAASAVTPMGYTYDCELLRASGRLRDGGVLDLTPVVLSPAQMSELVQSVADAVLARLANNSAASRSYAQAATQGLKPSAAVPNVPARSAPWPTLQQAVQSSKPAAVPQPTSPAPPSVPQPSAQSIDLTGRALNKGKGRAVTPPAPSLHPMATRSTHRMQPVTGQEATSSRDASPAPSDDNATPLATTAMPARRSMPAAKLGWQRVRKGLPLGKAVAYCEARGIKVGLHLMAPKELRSN